MLACRTLFFSLFVVFTLGENGINNNCRSKDTCDVCIREPDCVWCIKPKSEIHCIHKNQIGDNLCDKEHVVNPRREITILEDKPFSNTKNGEAVQIRPQKIKLKLRKGEEFSLPFQYAQAENYPVDLYYIMDLSASMEDHREKLAKLGDKLAKTMMNITNNFRLGFGSFVDKVDLPFVSTVPQKYAFKHTECPREKCHIRLKTPCKLNKNGKTVICVSPYSFKNHISLTEDYRKFSEQVFQARVSGNLDSPEGGFDALMQAIVCKNSIGWRTQARHLIVFSTDAEFHIAGDGKLAGIVEPNNAQCYMKDNSYTHDLAFDYPSVSQINHVAKENNINIVFAIVNKKRVVNIYKQLSESIENSNIGVLDEKSENVINLVLDNYNKIVDSVTISSNSSSDIEVKITSTCSHPKINGCTNIHIGEIVNFTAIIKPLQCTKGSNNHIITIKPEALDESIVIDLEVLCDCDCTSQASNSENCSNSGALRCGVCDCNPGFFGKTCECSRETSDSADISLCKISKNDTRICSGLGFCRCGQCQCNQRSNPDEKIFGKYCDCDNYSCKRVNGRLCSQRGSCECGGICKCNAGWTGDACECPDNDNNCIKPDNNLVCNGHGRCNCGKCECFDEEVRYSGKYCDECPTCEGQRCEELRSCVECLTYKSGIFNEEECRINCTFFQSEAVDKLENSQDSQVKTCTLVDDNDCTFAFQYEYITEKTLKVVVEKEKVCRGPPNLLAWILGVIGSVLMAGLILLFIWKLCTTVHDRKEYAKFENERKKMQWHRNDNPLYKQATSTFANPLYTETNIHN